MIKFQEGEKWKEFDVHRSLQFRYAVSNYGRLISFTDKITNGKLIKGGRVRGGYVVFTYRVTVKGKKIEKKLYLHRLVAENFLKKKSSKQEYVIHLNFKRYDNSLGNLRWATREEMFEHNKKSPLVIKARKKLIEFNKNRDGHKLTVKEVTSLKKKIADPKRKVSYKVLAKQYGISEMQLYRVKSGENWGHIKI